MIDVRRRARAPLRLALALERREARGVARAIRLHAWLHREAFGGVLRSVEASYARLAASDLIRLPALTGLAG